LSTSKTLTETASNLGKRAGEAVEELGRSAGSRLDEAREETGRALHTAASSVRDTAQRGSEAIDNLSSAAAGRLDATASYVETHDLSEMLRRFGLRHLTGSLLAAAAVGFLAGSAVRRMTHSCGRAPQST
jgi:ABC-type transporter Mla subunit MlaD